MTRGLMGVGLPVIFLIHLLISGRRPPLRFVLPGLAIASAPSAFWYANMIAAHGNWFFGVHSAWLDREVYGPLSPPWRQFTGHFEYAWMIAKSCWPWLPFMLIGLIVAVRRRERRLSLLLVWIAVVFLMCGAARSRVLRYMLPAYPAFSILAAVGIQKIFRERHIARGLQTAVPVFAIAVVTLALFARPRRHAEVVRPIALAATAATTPEDRVIFYDAGQPRFDETNQMQWYGDRYLAILLTHAELNQALKPRRPEVMVVDQQTYAADIEHRVPNHVIARSGHLVCVGVRAARGAAM